MVEISYVEGVNEGEFPRMSHPFPQSPPAHLTDWRWSWLEKNGKEVGFYLVMENIAVSWAGIEVLVGA